MLSSVRNGQIFPITHQIILPLYPDLIKNRIQKSAVNRMADSGFLCVSGQETGFENGGQREAAQVGAFQSKAVPSYREW